MHKQSTKELLNELFNENEIPMSDRNATLYDAILDSEKKKSRNGWLFFWIGYTLITSVLTVKDLTSGELAYGIAGLVAVIIGMFATTLELVTYYSKRSDCSHGRVAWVAV